MPLSGADIFLRGCHIFHKSLVCPETTEKMRGEKEYGYSGIYRLEEVHIYEFRELSTCTA